MFKFDLEAFGNPRETLIVTSEREAMVKALCEGRFQPLELGNGMWRVDKPHYLKT